MIQVKENLYEGHDIYVEPINKAYNSMGIKIPGNLVDGEQYTFYTKVKQSHNGSGKCGFVIRKLGYPNSVWAVLPSDNFVYKFIYNKETQNEILLYSDVQEKTNNVGAKFYNISIVKGDGMDIYLPHKSKIKAENQAIFLARGGIPRGVSTLIGLGVGYAS